MLNFGYVGFQLEGASANNQVLYLDSYGNRDPRKNGESADGKLFSHSIVPMNLIKSFEEPC